MRRAWIVIAVGCGSPATSEPPAVDATAVALEDVATGLVDPTGLAVDASAVYVAHAGGELARVAKAGGAVTPLAPVQRGPASLDASTDRLCWVSAGTHAQDFLDGSVRCVPKLGGAVVELAASYFPSGLAIDGETLYWVEIDGQRVRAVGLDGTGARTLDATSTSKAAIAVAPARLAWTASGEGADVVVMDRETGATTPVTSSEYAPGTIRFAGDDVVWVTRHALSDAGAIRRWRDGTTSDVVSDEPWPAELVVQGGALYWTSGGRIRGLVEGEVRTVVADRGTIRGLAGDGEYLYWCEPDRGAIVRVRP